MEQDPFERSLRDLLNQAGAQQPPSQALERVLKKASRQASTGAILLLLGRALEGLLIALNSGSAHWRPVSRRTHPLNRQGSPD